MQDDLLELVETKMRGAKHAFKILQRPQVSLFLSPNTFANMYTYIYIYIYNIHMYIYPFSPHHSQIFPMAVTEMRLPLFES